MFWSTAPLGNVVTVEPIGGGITRYPVDTVE
jgi:hypothetical protein